MRFLLAVLIACSVAKAEPVDFSRVNPVMQAITDAVVAGDDMVSWAKPKWDETKSSLDGEKLKYDLTGEMKRTLWGTGARASLYGTSTVWADHDALHSGVAVVSTTGARTDVLALLRYGATIALGRAPKLASKFEPRVLDHLHRMMTVTSLDQVYELLQSGRKLALDIIDDEIAHGCGEDCRRAREAYATTEIRVARLGRAVTKISLVSKSAAGFVARTYLAVVPRKTELVLSNHQAEWTLEGFAPLSSERMDALKKSLTERLVGLEKGAVDEKEAAQQTFKRALYVFKSVVQGWF